MELLYERDALPSLALPDELASRYGGHLGFPRHSTYANFVAALDGVVALPGDAESGRVVSGASDADRFVMALLRAFADVVVIGAGTFRKARRAFWHSQDAYPELAESFAALRRQQGLGAKPLLVVVSASGRLDFDEPALRNAWIATSGRVHEQLESRVPTGAKVVSFDPERVPVRALFERLHAEGFQRILTEGGPTLFGELIASGLVDELFVTTSPRLFGRTSADGKKSLIEGVDLGGRELELLGVRRDGSHLFLRYSVEKRC